MNATIDEACDGLETAILLALHARKRVAKVSERVVERNGKWSRIETDFAVFCPRQPEFPRDMLAMDVGGNGRIYSADLSTVLVDPIKAIGRGLEIGFLCEDGTFKWTKYKPMDRPRGIVAITNQPVHWFAVHYRAIKEGQPQVYVRTPLAISGGRVAPLKALGWNGYNANEERDYFEEQLAIALSIFEDAHRAGCIMATVEESARLSFPVSAESYKSFFALRDGLKDTPTGRRNPILHWCSEHMRKTWRGETRVTGHDRGAAEIAHGNMRLSLSRPEGYLAYTAGA